MLERFGAKEPARSRPLTPRRLWRRESCAGPRYEIFTLGSEQRNGGRGPTAVDVRNGLGAWRAPRPATLPLTMCPSSSQAIRAAGARADQVGGGGCLKRQAKEKLDYTAQAIDETARSMRLAEIKKDSLRLLSLRAAAAPLGGVCAHQAVVSMTRVSYSLWKSACPFFDRHVPPIAISQ